MEPINYEHKHGQNHDGNHHVRNRKISLTFLQTVEDSSHISA